MVDIKSETQSIMLQDLVARVIGVSSGCQFKTRKVLRRDNSIFALHRHDVDYQTPLRCVGVFFHYSSPLWFQGWMVEIYGVLPPRYWVRQTCHWKVEWQRAKWLHFGIAVSYKVFSFC
ncbi:hypothetical protein CDAR_304691 [Caerostris darwini]|uniref:Uncharacterized protein n=1 Tax=Caerostris darwini TaxID=1538125 RepID=A0AAV4PSQ6_9ARAC|nr:hypothetical protein CDAR_304691 [Caerostris darwini]